jgi:hypothetical protein
MSCQSLRSPIVAAARDQQVHSRHFGVLAALAAVALTFPVTVLSLTPGVTPSFQPAQEYTPGQALEVRLTVTQFAGGTRLRLEDEFPSGWSISQITPPGHVVGGKVLWEMALPSATTRTMSYRATPPVGFTGVAELYYSAVMSNDTSSQSVVRTRRVLQPHGGAACRVTCQATADPTIGTVPFQVSFSATADLLGCSGRLAYEWDFGDGSAHSNETGPVHSYQTVGSFTWRLKVSGANAICQRSGGIWAETAQRSQPGQVRPAPTHAPHGPVGQDKQPPTGP